MKKMLSFRLDPLAASRLEYLAKTVGLSQADFLGQLINAAFSCQTCGWLPESMHHFTSSMYDRQELIDNGDSPE